MNFENYNSAYALKITGLEKIVHEDSIEKGQGKFVCAQNIDFLNNIYYIDKDKISVEVIRNTFINFLREGLYEDSIDEKSVSINEEHGMVFLCTSENEDAEILTENLEEFEEKGGQLYICDYTFSLKINNVLITAEDLEEIFPFNR